MKICPKDSTILEDKHIKGQRLAHCLTCQGLWIHPSVIQATVGQLPDLSSYATTTRTCPEDSSSMVSIQHQGVEIDICRKCGGVWLDRGELDRIRHKMKLLNAPAQKNADNPLVALDVVSVGLEVVNGCGEVASDIMTGVLEFIFEAFSIS